MLRLLQTSEDGERLEHPVAEVLASGRSPYQEYLFFRSPVHGVCVALDGDLQSCEADEALYHEALVHPAMLLHPDPRRVLIMGGGEGATAREVLRHPGVERAVMVDIDETFVALCREHLADWNRTAFADPRLELQCRDINAYLEEAGPGFDVVIGDLVDFSDEDAPAAALYSRDLYARLRRRLNPGAVLATQAGGLTAHRQIGHRRVRRSLGGAFGALASYALTVPSFYHLWSFVLASDGALPDGDTPPLETFRQRVAERGLELPATGPAALAGAFTLPAAIAGGVSGTGRPA
ncbi:methyltransferase domain-containing protein [Spiribacter halobius]|uniref:Polyamine aminopropyltransferase n=1 Tax=Sediminicurvatus halobius TaxID=2182432 RepID=A0A2U2N2F0_9GAMM|nr:methyltransferase domain-containing protein [Spiribacter halobius]PWG63218.1 spermidine synthase [Spiribacter halobius]UEX76712.1 methyltransferase domain-containing protein [Spiribacter halobius]